LGVNVKKITEYNEDNLTCFALSANLTCVAISAPRRHPPLFRACTGQGFVVKLIFFCTHIKSLPSPNFIGPRRVMMGKTPFNVKFLHSLCVCFAPGIFCSVISVAVRGVSDVTWAPVNKNGSIGGGFEISVGIGNILVFYERPMALTITTLSLS